MEIGFKSLKSDPCVFIYSAVSVTIISAQYINDVLLLVRIGRKLLRISLTTDMRDPSCKLEMRVSRKNMKGAVIVTQDNYTKSLIEVVRYDNLKLCVHAESGKIAFAGPDGGETAEHEGRAAIADLHGFEIYFRQVIRYSTLPSKVHMAEAKHLLCYLAGTTGFAIAYKQENFERKVAGPTTRKTASRCLRKYYAFECHGELQGETARTGSAIHGGGRATGWSTMTKESVFFSNMAKRLGFNTLLGRVLKCTLTTSRLSTLLAIGLTARE